MAEHTPKPGGLQAKYKVTRMIPSSSGTDHTDCFYFVLDPAHDPIARQVLAEYAALSDQVGDHKLASDLWFKLWQLARKEG